MKDSAAAHVDDGFGVTDVNTAPVVGVTAASPSTTDPATSATTRRMSNGGRVTDVASARGLADLTRLQHVDNADPSTRIPCGLRAIASAPQRVVGLEAQVCAFPALTLAHVGPHPRGTGWARRLHGPRRSGPVLVIEGTKIQRFGSRCALLPSMGDR